MFRPLSLVFLFLLLSSLVLQPCFARGHSGGGNSGAAGIMLRAVLAQSLSVSAAPHAEMFDSFINSAGSRDFPVTFKTLWVRGPGSVSVVVLSSPEWTG